MKHTINLGALEKILRDSPAEGISRGVALALIERIYQAENRGLTRKMVLAVSLISCSAQGMIGPVVATIVRWELGHFSPVPWAMFMAGWVFSLVCFLVVFIILSGFVNEQLRK